MGLEEQKGRENAISQRTEIGGEKKENRDANVFQGLGEHFA